MEECGFRTRIMDKKIETTGIKGLYGGYIWTIG